MTQEEKQAIKEWLQSQSLDPNQNIDPVEYRVLKTFTSRGMSDLIETSSSYLQPYPRFEPGQIVRYKRGLKNSRWPMYGQPTIVIEQIEGKTTTCTDSTSDQYSAPSDLRVGLFNFQGYFNTWWLDARRMEICPPNELELMIESLEMKCRDFEENLND